MKHLDAALSDVRDWEVVCRYLPDGWREAARETGALARARGVADAENLLRVLLIHLACGCSLKETAVRAQDAGLAQMNHAAIGKRLRAAKSWLRWLAERTRGDPTRSLVSLGRRLVAVDATAITEPGSTGTDYRVHYAVNLADLQCVFFRLTDVRVGETFRLLPVAAGDVMMGDRVYANPHGVAHVVDAKGDVLVRLNRTSLPLYNQSGKRLDVLRLARKARVGKAIEYMAYTEHPKTKALIPGRLVITKRTKEATRLAQRALRRKSSRKQTRLTKEAMEAATYFFVYTTLPSEIPSETILEYYRDRWQIELVFKRLKSIMNLGHLPKTNPDSAEAWLHGKLLVGFLVNRILAAAAAFSPWGCPLEQPT